MPEIFHDRNLSDSTFWGVNLQRTLFRDADLSGANFFHVFLKDVRVDGEIDRLVINGVDVTDYVNEHDRWWPLRNNLSPNSVDGLRESWAALSMEWRDFLNRVSTTDESLVHASVNGEWTLTETVRHLIFAMDKWFTMPILGFSSFSAMGLPNTESQDHEWPGIDLQAVPDFTEVLQARAEQHERFSAFVATLRPEDLPKTVTIEENGVVPAFMCFHVVLEEEFEHLRYMIRDLATLGVPSI